MADPNNTTRPEEPIALSLSRERIILEQTLLRYVNDAKKILQHLKEFDQALKGHDTRAMLQVRRETQQGIEKIVGGKTADPIVEERRTDAAISRGVQAVNMLMKQGYYKKIDQQIWRKWESLLGNLQYDMTPQDIDELIANFEKLQVYIPSI